MSPLTALAPASAGTTARRLVLTSGVAAAAFGLSVIIAGIADHGCSWTAEGIGGFLALIAAGFLLARAERSRGLLVSSFAATILMAWFVSGAYGTYGGLVQRAFVIFAYGLPIFVALRLTRSPDRV